MTADASARTVGRPELDYAGLFDASPNPCLVLDCSLNIVGANPAYLQSVRRSLADIVGRWAWDAFPTDSETMGLTRASLERVLRTGKPDTLALLRLDVARPEAEGGGFEERYWSGVHTPVLDADGNVSLIVSHPIDVTELRRQRDTARPAGEERRAQVAPAQGGIFDRARAVQDANLQLQAESTRLRALFEQAPGFMCVLRGSEHRFELANAAYLRLVGHRNLLGRTVRDALPEIDGQGFFELLDRVYATGEPFVGHGAEATFQANPHSTPEQRVVDFVYQPITGDDGQVTGIFVQGTDVTERTRAEAQVREGEARLRLALDGGGLGDYEWDVRADAVRSSARAREIFGFGPGEGERSADYFARILPEDLPGARAAVEAGLATGQVAYGYRIRLPGGAVRHVRSHGIVVRGADSAPARLIGVFADETEAKQAEEAIRASEEHWRGLFERLQEGLILGELVRDAVGRAVDWRYLEVNPIWGRLVGVPPGAAAGRTVREVFPGIEDEWVSEMAAVVDTGQPAAFTRQVGELGRWYEGRAHRVGPERFAVIFAEVTERRRTEERRLALAELGERIRGLDDPADVCFAAAEILGRTLGVARAGYGTVDAHADTTVVERDWTVPGAESLTGVLGFRDYGSFIEDLKRGETVVVADVTRDPRTAASAGAFAAIGARAIVHVPVTEQGGLVAVLYLNDAAPREWAADDLNFVREVAGRTRTAVARLSAEWELRALAASLEQQVAARTQALAGSEARFRAYFDASPENLFLVRVPAEGHATFVDLNPAAEALYGLPRDAVVGRSPDDILDPATAEDVERRARECLGLGRPLRYETERRFRTGRRMVLNVVAAPLPAPEDGEARVLFCGRDLTEQRQAEEALRQSQKMEAVGQLTGGIAHDFNNMLQAIGGGLELAQRRVEQGRAAEAARYVEGARTTVARAAALTHRLLAFSRRQALQPRTVEPDALIAGMAELVRQTAGPGIAVELRTGGAWAVLCDPNQLENVLLNLAINARDAMPEGGRLTFSTRDVTLAPADVAGQDGVAAGDYVEIAVADTGAGMDEATRARAFEPFFTTKPIGQGTGLGLSQAYGFVRQSDGMVRLDSVPGQGTTVRLCLPRHAPSPQASAPPEPQGQASGAGAGGVVLLVEDEREVRAVLGARLREGGHRVLEAADGPAALRLLHDGAPVDLLVTDVGLPGGLNGRQVADAARERRPGLPVLFVTGYAGSVLDSQLAPGMAVIGKPFSLDAMAAKVQAMLEAVLTD